jgi:hypothetical protein
LRSTEYSGAYLTDFFKGLVIPGTREVQAAVEERPVLLDKAVKAFRAERDLL